MHEHSFKKTRRTGGWIPSAEPGTLMSYEEWVNVCECGETAKIKTSHTGVWKKSASYNGERVVTLPSGWQEALRKLLKSRPGHGSEISIPAERAVGITGLDWRELDEMLAVLLRDGAVELFEPYPRNPRKGKVVFRAGTVEKLRGILGMDAREKEAAAITSFFDSWEHPRDMDGAPLRVASVLDALEALWRSDGRAALPPVGGRVTVLKSLSNYAVILDALRGIFNLTLLGDTVSLRELSTDVAGDSKALDRVKPYLRELLGDLGGYGVDEHSSLIYCRLPVAGTVGGKAVDLSACEDYISLTVKTARAFSPVSSSMKRIILVENLTPFERLAGEPGLTEGGTGIAFLSGYPPGHVREFIKRIAHGVEALIWCDLDPDGVAIALTAAKWFKQWRPFFMDKDYLLTSRAKPLEDHDYLKLSSLKNSAGGSAFGPLLGDMERLGVKVEQEAQRVSISNLP